MPSNVPTLVPQDVFSVSSHWNVMKDDMDTVWDAFPKRDSIDHKASTIVVGGSWAWSTNASHDGTWYYISPGADGDTFTNEVVLSDGTYTMYAYGVTGPTAAKIDWYLGGNLLGGGGQDWYTGGVVYDVTKTISGITVVTEPSRLVLQGVVNGRNASASGWVILLSRVWFKRSADT